MYLEERKKGGGGGGGEMNTKGFV
jgi:hypothetical protein